MAQTNVQAFSGDVEISSNLAVSGSKFTYDNTNTTVFTGTADAVANEIGYLDMSTSSSSNNIHVKVYIKYGQSAALGDAEYSFYIRPNTANYSLIYDYRNQNGPITPVVYRTNASDLWSGGTPGVVRFGYSDASVQNVMWRVEVYQRSNNATFYPTNTGSAMVTTGLVQVTPAPFTRFDSNVRVGSNNLFVDTVGGTVGIGTTLIDITDNIINGAGNGLYIHNPVEGGHLLTLGTQRPWVFEQGLSDASTELILRSLNSGKKFSIQSPDYSNVMTVVATNGGGNVGIGTNNPTGFEVYNKTINQKYRDDFTNIHVNNKYQIDARDDSAPNTLSQRYGVRAADNAGLNPEIGELIIGAHADQNDSSSDATFISFNDSGYFYIATHPTANYGEDVTLESNHSYPYIGADTNNRISPQFTVRSSGNVGIGMTTPTSTLNVASTLDPASATDSAAFDKYSVVITNTIAGDSDDTEMGIAFANFGSTNFPNNVQTPGAAITHERVDAWSKGKLHFKTKGNTSYDGNCSTRMTIDETGNVGIGTTTSLPGMLSIYTGATSKCGFSIDRYASGNYRTEFYQASYGLDIKVGYSSITAPISIVHVERFSSTNARLRIDSPGYIKFDGGVVDSAYNDISDAKMILATTGRFRLYDNGNSLYFSSAGGNGTLAATTVLSMHNNSGAGYSVGIGTTNPGNYGLYVDRSARLGAGSSIGGGSYLSSMYLDVFGESSNKVCLFRSTEDDDVVYYRFRNQQSVHQREIGGVLQGYYTNASDDRLKVNERYLTDGLDVIKRLKPQVYDKRPDLVENLERDGYNVESIERKEVGFIAQDLYYEVPELKHIVHVGGGIVPAEHITIGDDPTEDPDYSSWGNVAAGVRYTEIIPYNTAAIQDLSNLRDLDVDRITVLESQVSNLLARVQTLESGTP